MELSNARRLKALEDENARLKRLLADSMPRFRRAEKICWERVYDAGRAARCCAPSDAGSRHLAAPGVQARRCRSWNGPARLRHQAWPDTQNPHAGSCYEW